MYTESYKPAPFCGAGMEVRQNLHGDMSPERPEMYLLSYKLALCLMDLDM